MNETLKVLETRRSCRNFIPDKMVSEEDIQAIVKAGTYAATGMGRQILSELGIEGDYEGIGHCAIGYAAEPAKEPIPRKENYVYYVK